MIREFCSKEDMTRVEHEFHRLTIRNTSLATYIVCFEDLPIVSLEWIVSESKNIEAYIMGLAPLIQRMIYTGQSNTYKDARQVAFNLTKSVIKKKPFKSRKSNKGVNDFRKKWEEGPKGESNRSSWKREDVKKS